LQARPCHLRLEDYPISSQPGDIIEAVSRADDRQSIIVGPVTGDPVARFARSVADGLRASPPRLESRYLYDETGSRLFEEICEQPEYYLTRTEDALLERHAEELDAITGSVTLIELGSGNAAKTERLLAAYAAGGRRVLYVPVDVSQEALERARCAVVARHPDVTVTGIAGSYEHAFPLFRRFSPSMVLFLGSTVGNLDAAAAERFWSEVYDALAPGDFFLLGVDLVKDKAILDAAYNDAAGRTAAFTANLVTRINRELGASVDPDGIEHVAEYSEAREQVEIHLRFLTDQEVRIAPLDVTIPVPAGTLVRTEISRKFRLDPLCTDLARHGLDTSRVLTDDRGWFALLLLRRSD